MLGHKEQFSIIATDRIWVSTWCQSLGGLNLQVEESIRKTEEKKCYGKLGYSGVPAKTKCKFEQERGKQDQMLGTQGHLI